MDTQSISSTTSSINTPRRRGVPENIKKQFAQDLESNGGLKHFIGSDNQHLSRLLDINSDFYGVRGEREELHKKLRSLAQYWNNLGEDAYHSRILNPWRIVQYSARNSNERNIPIQSPTTRNRRRSSSTRQGANISVADSSQSSSDSETIQNPRIPQRPPQRQNPPRNVSVPTQPVQDLSRNLQDLSIMDNPGRSLMSQKLFGRSSAQKHNYALPPGASKFTTEVLIYILALLDSHQSVMLCLLLW